MKNIVISLIGCLWLFSICGLTAKAQAAGIDDACFIMPVELADKLNNKEDVLLIDCRNKTSFSEMHIESAVNIPVSKIKSVGNDYEKAKGVCKINCVNGYNLIYNLMGGDYGRNQGRAFRRVVERVQESGRFARQERDFQGAAKAAA